MNYLKSLILRLFPLSFLFFLFAVPGFAASLPVDFFGARAFGNGGTFYYEMKEGDFNGDGKTDIAVFRNGIWYIQRTTCRIYRHVVRSRH